MIRYNDPGTARTFLVEITRLVENGQAYYVFRILDGVPGRYRSAPYRHYLDCARAALIAARALCGQPPH